MNLGTRKRVLAALPGWEWEIACSSLGMTDRQHAVHRNKRCKGITRSRLRLWDKKQARLEVASAND